MFATRLREYAEQLRREGLSRNRSGEVISKRIVELCIIEPRYATYLAAKGERSMRELPSSNEVIKENKL